MFKKWYSEISKKRFKVINGYKLDRWLFQAGMYLIFFVLFSTVYVNNFDLDYFYCPENSDGSISGLKIMLDDYESEGAVVDGNCRNPFSKDSWKIQEYLPPGEYGNKPGPMFQTAIYSPLIIFGIFLLFNHFRYNGGFKISLEEK